MPVSPAHPVSLYADASYCIASVFDKSPVLPLSLCHDTDDMGKQNNLILFALSESLLTFCTSPT
jgi:hypothetical protein